MARQQKSGCGSGLSGGAGTERQRLEIANPLPTTGSGDFFSARRKVLREKECAPRGSNPEPID
jgi:hypothetical protein